MSDTVDAVKNIGAKAFAGAGSSVYGLEAITDTSLLSSVDSQVVMGILGVCFLMGGLQVVLNIVDDLGDL